MVCEECQFAAHELLEVFDDHDTQAQIHDFMSETVCAHLGQYSETVCFIRHNLFLILYF